MDGVGIIETLLGQAVAGRGADRVGPFAIAAADPLVPGAFCDHGQSYDLAGLLTAQDAHDVGHGVTRAAAGAGLDGVPVDQNFAGVLTLGLVTAADRAVQAVEAANADDFEGFHGQRPGFIEVLDCLGLVGSFDDLPFMGAVLAVVNQIIFHVCSSCFPLPP